MKCSICLRSDCRVAWSDVRRYVGPISPEHDPIGYRKAALTCYRLGFERLREVHPFDGVAREVLLRVREAAGLKPNDGISLVEHVHALRKENDRLETALRAFSETWGLQGEALAAQLADAKATVVRLRKSRERWRAYAERLRYVSPTLTNLRNRAHGTCACGKWGLGGVAAVRLLGPGRSTHGIDACVVGHSKWTVTARRLSDREVGLDPQRRSGAV